MTLSVLESFFAIQYHKAFQALTVSPSPDLGSAFPINPNFFQREWYFKTTSEPQRYSFFPELVIFNEQSQEMHILDMNICFQNTIPHKLILVLPIQNWVQKIFTGFREQYFLSSSMLIIIFDALSTQNSVLLNIKSWCIFSFPQSLNILHHFLLA